MNILWMQVPPHTFWGWAGEISIGLALLVFIWPIVLMALAVSEGSRARLRSHTRHTIALREQQKHTIARREQQAAARAAYAIDEIYRRAEEEVRRLGQLARTPVAPESPNR